MGEKNSSSTNIGGGNREYYGNGAESGQSPSNNYNYLDGNEITLSGKFWAGLLLIGLTAFSCLYLIGHWPDRLPTPDETIKPLYSYGWFNVRLAGVPDSGRILRRTPGTVAEKPGIVPDTPIRRSSTDSASGTDTPPRTDTIGAKRSSETQALNSNALYREKDLIHINTLLLILVAIGGFIGNMIHISTSFTTYIGSGQYKKTWGLWYVVKPFTAAALAVAIYFVFRGGFLNMSDDSTNINLYGLMTIAILSGLFTDRTTLKLKEVFEVLLRPKEERTDPLTEDKPQLISITGEPLEADKPVTVTITGKNLDKKPLTIKVEDTEIGTLTVQPATITFSYTLPAELKSKDSVKMQVFLGDGTEAWPARQLPIKKSTEGSSESAARPADLDSTGVNSNEAANQMEFGDPDTEDDDINKPQE